MTRPRISVGPLSLAKLTITVGYFGTVMVQASAGDKKPRRKAGAANIELSAEYAITHPQWTVPMYLEVPRTLNKATVHFGQVPGQRERYRKKVAVHNSPANQALLSRLPDPLESPEAQRCPPGSQCARF